MMKIDVYSEKSGNFASDSKMKPMIIIESKRKSFESLKAKYPDAMIIDVTSHAQDEFVKFSPFYPNGGIPVPFTEGLVAVSVEGIWQGLKVFEDVDIDTSLFSKPLTLILTTIPFIFNYCVNFTLQKYNKHLVPASFSAYFLRN